MAHVTLTEFLLARIAEDEAVAKEHPDLRLYVDDDGRVEPPIDTWDDGTDRLPNRHTAWVLLYDSARVLAECEAKRRIVGLYSYVRMSDPDYPPVVPLGGDGPETYYEAIQLLAAVYVDHPDYRQEWKP